MARFMTGATAFIVLLCCVAASAAPRDKEVYRVPPQLEGRARIVKVQAPRAVDPNAKAMDDLAEWEAPAHPADIVVEVINDEAVARGVTAAGPEYEAIVFDRPFDSEDGWFLDNTPGTVQWQQMIPDNGFEPSSDTLSSFVARVEVSTYDLGSSNISPGFTLELWDGDPLGVQDTTCSAGGVPAPIPGSTCTFSNLPGAGVYDLKCVFPEEVMIPGGCDQVFGVVWPGDVCRWAWRVADRYYGGAPPPPEFGACGAVGMVYACEQFGQCATPSGYNSGTCCETGEACDHTDPDPANWTPEGGCTWWEGLAMHPTFCQDDAADYFYALSDYDPPYYASFVSQLWARADIVMQVVPMSVDVIPGTGPPPPDVTISGNEVTIDQAYPGGERHLWFEVYVSDWDPGDTGITVKAWQAGLDSSGYTAGLACTLEPWKPACDTDADCIAVQGPIGSGALKGGCGLPGYPAGQCAAGLADESRTDFIFYMQDYLGGIDQGTWNYRYGATLFGLPIQSPHIGDMYLGTLTLKTSCDCPAGDFHVGLGISYQNSNLVQGDSHFVPLLGVRGADVIFPTGRCCNISASPNVCLSDTFSRCECEQMGIEGSFMVNFDPTKTCADECVDVGPPTPDPPRGEPGYGKVRSISFVPRAPGVQTALRVTLAMMPPPFAGFSGQQRWVGPVREKCENGGVLDPPCPSVPLIPDSFQTARLVCDPYCMDYGSVGAIHVTDDEIIPNAVYDVQMIECSSDFGDEANYSDPLRIDTSNWGDLIENCTVSPCGPPDGLVNVTTDVVAVLDKFKNRSDAVMKVRADLVPNVPDWVVNITDVTFCLDAFLGFPYPPTGWAGPGGCP